MTLTGQLRTLTDAFTRTGTHARSINCGHALWPMFEASMHPVVLGWEFQYLGLEKRVHATRIIRVAS